MKTQQEASKANFIKPTVKPVPVDFSKVNFADGSLYDQALLERVQKIEALIEANEPGALGSVEVAKAAIQEKTLTPEEQEAQRLRKIADLKRQLQELDTPVQVAQVTSNPVNL